MVDIEKYVIDTVAKAVKDAYGTTYPGLTIQGRSVDVPESFPCVTVEEIGNSVYRKTQDEAVENEATVTYDINVYANDINTKKSVAKKIANTVDTAMKGLNFTRLLKTPTPNVDRTIYRYTLRYEAVVGSKIGTGANAYYPIYRR